MPRSKLRKKKELGREKTSQMLTVSSDGNRPKKKILWANSFCMLDTSSGASISIRQILIQLANNGFDLEIVGATIFDDPKGIEGLGNAWQQIQKAKTSVVNVPDDKLIHRLVKTASTERSALTEQEATNIFMLFLTRMDYFVPDLIFFYGGSILNSLIASEARLRGIPTVAYLVNENYQGSRWCKDVDLIVTDTNATSNFYKEKMGFIPKVIGKFIDPKKIIATQHERKHLTFVNPSYAKGAGIIAQIAIILEKKRPDITLEIVESRGDWPSILRDVSRDFFKEEKHTLSNVILTPNTKKMDEVYKRSRVLLGLSVWWESGSRVLAEAMLNGIPAIVTNNGGSPEMVESGGFVIDLPHSCFISPYNQLPGMNKINEIILLIEKLWDDEIFYLQAMTNALQVGFQKHDISISTNKIINEFDQLIERKPVSPWKEKLKEAHFHGLYPDEVHYGVGEAEEKPVEKQPHKIRTVDNKCVAMVTPFFWPDQNGMEMAFDKLATEFEHQGYSIDMYAPTHKFEFKELESKYRIFRIKDQEEFLQILKKRNQTKSYDYILCQSAYVGASLALMAQKELNIPVILRTHGIDVQKDPENEYGWRLDPEKEKIILENINNVNGCVISAQLTEEFKRIAPNTPSRVIQSGIDPKRFFQEKNKFLHTHLQLDPDTRIILMAGRNVKKKNFHLGLEAFKYLQKYEKKTFLVHIGREGNGENLNEYAKALNLENSFTSLGQISHMDVPKYYNSAEILLFPSKTEVFGNVTLEAMACGLVPVEFDYGANRDKIKNGKNGFIIPFGDTISMGKILRSLLKSPKKLKSIQTAAVEYSKEEFAISKTVREYEKLFYLAKQNFLSK